MNIKVVKIDKNKPITNMIKHSKSLRLDNAQFFHLYHLANREHHHIIFICLIVLRVVQLSFHQKFC